MLNPQKPLLIYPNEKLGVTYDSLIDPDTEIFLISERKLKLLGAELDKKRSIVYWKRGIKSLSGFYYDEQGIKCEYLEDNSFTEGHRVLGAYKTRDGKRCGLVLEASSLISEDVLVKFCELSRKEVKRTLRELEKRNYIVRI